MMSLLILPNTIIEDSIKVVKFLDINHVFIILEPYYLHEGQHIQKLALMHACIDFFAGIDLGVPVSIIEKHIPKRNEVSYIFEPLDKEMYDKYKYCEMVKNSSILLTRDEVMEMPLFTKQSEFYKYMRNKFDILMTKDKPKGGRWSFDAFNRNKFPKQYTEQPIYSRGLIEEVREAYPNAYGSSTKLHYPSTFKSAKQYLKKFIDTKLQDFGKYQDAFDSEIQVGEHANISALMNIGMLTPAYVIKKVVKSDKDLQSIEGFIRQVLGWREYMRYVYLRMPNITKNTYLRKLGNTKIPNAWYTGKTGIPIFDNIISKTLETGYAHHIERLMVLNNSMIMYGFSHKEIYNWFMRMFVDSYEWVMVGCSYMNHNSLADKNRYMGRVYISSGNYIKKMSNYRGDSIEVFDALFKSFTNTHSELLSKDYMLASYISRYVKKKSK